MKYIVYVLQNPQGLLYKGVTSNIQRRLKEHSQHGNQWTHYRGPRMVVYTEEFGTRSEALQREKFLKSGQGREYLKTVIPPS